MGILAHCPTCGGWASEWWPEQEIPEGALPGYDYFPKTAYSTLLDPQHYQGGDAGMHQLMEKVIEREKKIEELEKKVGDLQQFIDDKLGTFG